MFGLTIKEPYVGYIGWRAIFHRGHVDVVPNRASLIGDNQSHERLLEWVNLKMVLPPPPKRKRPVKVTPWAQMQAAASNMSASSDENWELSEGPFVLRANPCASYGYLYIALFERDLREEACKRDVAPQQQLELITKDEK